MIELEKKFLIKESEKEKLLKKAGKILLLEKKIEQTYLFKENASVYYDLFNNLWVINLKNNFNSTTIYVKEEKKLDAYKVLKQFNQEDLVLVNKTAMRLRQVDNKIIFTFKYPKNKLADYEFENEISAVDYNNQKLKSFLLENKFKIEKERIVLLDEKTNLKYEIDKFKKIKDIILEIEFDSEDDYVNFKPDFEGVDVTGDYKYSNKYISTL